MQAPESARIVEAPSEGSVDRGVATSDDAMLVSFRAELQSLVEFALRPLRKLEDSLCLWLARASDLLEQAEVSDGERGLSPASLQGPCSLGTSVHGLTLPKDGSKGVDDIGDKVGLAPSRYVAAVESTGQHASVKSMALYDKVATELSLPTSASNEVWGVAKGCTSAFEGQNTLHVFIELVKSLSAVPAITQGLIHLVNAAKIKNVNQLAGVASGVGTACHDVSH